jgi:hypothetical protein
MPKVALPLEPRGLIFIHSFAVLFYVIEISVFNIRKSCSSMQTICTGKAEKYFVSKYESGPSLGILALKHTRSKQFKKFKKAGRKGKITHRLHLIGEHEPTKTQKNQMKVI